jgi:hypothetical protein
VRDVFPGTFRVLVLVAFAALLAGCTVAPPPAPPSAPSSVTPVPQPGPPAPIPVSLQIPVLDVDSSLIPTGVDGQHRLQTPPVDKPEQASWFVGSPEPGEIGPAVLLGHVNGRGKPGVFLSLHKLKPGDLIVVNRDQAAPVSFKVRSVERFPKAAFPTERVYGNVDGPELRLITCGGVFDDGTGHYKDNVVVFAEAASDPPERP